MGCLINLFQSRRFAAITIVWVYAGGFAANAESVVFYCRKSSGCAKRVNLMPLAQPLLLGFCGVAFHITLASEMLHGCSVPWQLYKILGDGAL